MIHTSRYLRLITDTLCMAWGMLWMRKFLWCDLPIAFHRRQWGSALPWGVTSWSVQPWSYYRWWEAITASGPFDHCHPTVVASGSGWHLHKRIHNDNLPAVFVPPCATVLRDHLLISEKLWSPVSFLAGSRLWQWPVKRRKMVVASFERRLRCFPGQTECVFYG